MSRPSPTARRSYALLALLTVLGAGAAVVLLRPATYEATAQVVVMPVARDSAFTGIPVFRELGDPIRTVETAAALLQSREAAETTADQMSAGWTTDDVEERISVAPRGQTNIVDVTATATRPAEAAALADTYAAAALDRRRTAVLGQVDLALGTVRARLSQLPEGSPAALEAAGLQAELETARILGDPTSALAHGATPPSRPAGPPDVVILAASALAAVLVAASVLSFVPASAPRPGETQAVEPATTRRGPAVNIHSRSGGRRSDGTDSAGP